MDETKSSLFKSSMMSGLLLGIALVVISLIVYFIDLTGNKYISYLTMILMGAGVFYLQIQYRDKELHGKMTYGQAFGFAILVVLAAAVISSIFTFILTKFIDPGIIDKILSMQEDTLTKKGLTSEQIDMAMTMTKRMMTPVWMVIWGLVGMMFWGTILSLITSAFTKKESTPFSE